MKTNIRKTQSSPARLGTLFLALAGIAAAQSNTGTGPNPNVVTTNGTNAALGMTTGTNNSAYGFNALQLNTSGYSNSAFGANALNGNSTGINNAAFGAEALQFNTNNNNAAMGSYALRLNTTGFRNSAFGTSSLTNNTRGAMNSAVGFQALRSNTTGTGNTALGFQSLLSNKTGNLNIGLGDGALFNLKTGSGNIALGEDAGFVLTGGSGNIRIGNRNDGAADENGIIRIGESAIHTDTFIAGIIHGDGSGLTGITGSSLADGAVGSAQLAPNLSLSGNLRLPATTATDGAILVGGETLLHSFGIANFFAGSNAGNRTMTGRQNTASGAYALFSNNDGYLNTASGAHALFSNTTGSGNTASGASSLYHNTDGVNNTASGAYALYHNTLGYQNTAFGVNSLFSNTEGISNTAIGSFSLGNNSIGLDNTAIGVQALEYITTGSNNIGIGKSAGSLLTTGSDNIAIGHNGVADESSTTRIGTSQTRAFIAGIRGRTTGSNNAIPVLIDGDGQMGTVSSSRRYKEDIRDMGDSSARLQSLRPVTFRYKEAFRDGEKPVQYGLIAEEVAAAFPELAVFNGEGKPETVKYHDLVPMLLNEHLKERRRVDAELAVREKTIAEQKEEIRSLAATVADLKARDTDREKRLARMEALLGGAALAGGSGE